MGKEDGSKIKSTDNRVPTFEPLTELEKAAFLSSEAARAAVTSEVARQQGDAAAAARLLASAEKKSRTALQAATGH